MSRDREFAAKVGSASRWTNYAGDVAQTAYPMPPMDTKNLIEAMAAITGDFRWADRGDKFHAAPDTAEALPAGAYTGTMTEQGPMLVKKPERLEIMHDRHPTSERTPDAPKFGFPMANGLSGRHA